MEGGDLDHPITVRGSDELTTLASSLDSMRLTLRQQHEDEAAAAAKVKSLITEMSHDLRTPLTTLLLYTEILRHHKYETEAQQDEYLAKIDGKARQIKQLSDNLFEYALVTRDTVVQLDAPARFSQIFEEPLAEMVEMLQQRGFACALELGSVSDTLRSYSGAVASAQPTLAAGAALAQSVSGYLADMEADVRRVADSTAFQRFVELMESDSDSMAEYLASPVQMNTQIIYEIRDYGSAMAPYYVMLALFVGSLLTAVMVKVPVKQPEFRQCRGVQRYFGRFLTYFCMAMAQALVTAFGCLHFVGMETAEPALFVLGCCVCALNFAAMNYALVYSLDNVGLAASVIIMVLQVAGSGGSYPIDVLPQLFRRLYPFMPFHYGMDMLRETIGGMYGRTYLRCALILLGMCVLFTVFGLLVYYPARKLNAAIAASKEKSGIM